MQHRDGVLAIDVNNPGDERTIREVARVGNEVRFQINAAGGRRLTERHASEVSRAVLKAALEAAWLDHGETMFQAQFDHIRDNVLGTARSGFILISKSGGQPTDAVSLTYDFAAHDDGERMWAYLDFHGIMIATDSRLTRPHVQPPTDLIGLLTFTGKRGTLMRHDTP